MFVLSIGAFGSKFTSALPSSIISKSDSNSTPFGVTSISSPVGSMSNAPVSASSALSILFLLSSAIYS